MTALPLDPAELADLDHCTVRLRLEHAGWRLIGTGDWAVVLGDPDGVLAARVCAFEPGAYQQFVALCTRRAGRPHLPRIEVAGDLAGGGHVTVMERLAERTDLTPEELDSDDEDPFWAASDAAVAELRTELDRVDRECRSTVPWWGGLDLQPRHLMMSTDGRPVLVDPFWVAGEQLFGAVVNDYAAFCRTIPVERHRHLLQIPYYGRPESRGALAELRRATGL